MFIFHLELIGVDKVNRNRKKGKEENQTYDPPPLPGYFEKKNMKKDVYQIS
jgi:hypothetical protein